MLLDATMQNTSSMRTEHVSFINNFIALSSNI